MVCGTMKTSKTKMMLLGWEMSHWIRVFAAHTRKPEFGSLEPVQTVGLTALGYDPSTGWKGRPRRAHTMSFCRIQ